MKTQMKKLAAAALLICNCGYVSAQVSPKPPLPPAPLGLAGNQPSTDHRPAPPAPGMPLAAQLQVLTTINGKIIAYQSNEHYAYNSFTIQGDNGVTTVRFPEHLGQQLLGSAKKGEGITVKGFSSTGPDGVTAFQLVSATAGNVQISDTPVS